MFRLSLLAGTAALLLPQASFAQPATPAAQPADSAAQPADSATQPADSAAQPADSAAQPADSSATAAAQQPPAPANYHAQDSREIVVTGFRRNRSDVLSGTSVLSGEELTRDVRATIGDTLTRQPGVSATSYGPNAARPILRGFQGERIRLMTDGIGSLDVSNTSVDHAVAINPLTADRIEVLRGPSALLFGSSAVGGVVNVIDARIPRRVPDEPIHIEGLLSYGSAAQERSGNALVDVPIGSEFVVHFDGSYNKSDNLRVGGYFLSPALRREAEASPDPDIQALADLHGRLPNSGGRTWDIAGGAAWIHGENNVGFSINRLDSLYGIPLRFSRDPAVEPEQVRIALKQTRYDARAEIDTGNGFIDSIRLRGG